MNHAADDMSGEIAVNFNHFEEVANFRRQRLPFTLAEIKKLLKTGRERAFVKAGPVRSAVSKLFNTGKPKELCKPELYHCWIFKRQK